MKRPDRVSAVTVHAPHGTIEVDVRDGRIGRGEWQLLCSKLGLVEARYALRAAGVEVADGGEKARAGAVAGVAGRLADRYRSFVLRPRRTGNPERLSSSVLRGAQAPSFQ